MAQTVPLALKVFGNWELSDLRNIQNHAGMEDCDITIIALEGSHRSFVQVRDRIKGLAALHFVMYDCQFFVFLEPFDLR
jgi:hypothetical protein